MGAPVTAIVAFDLDFHAHQARTFPHRDVASGYRADPAHAHETAQRNGTLQGAYLMLAARALGLDIGPMSGFHNDGSMPSSSPASRCAATSCATWATPTTPTCCRASRGWASTKSARGREQDHPLRPSAAPGCVGPRSPGTAPAPRGGEQPSWERPGDGCSAGHRQRTGEAGSAAVAWMAPARQERAVLDHPIRPSAAPARFGPRSPGTAPAPRAGEQPSWERPGDGCSWGTAKRTGEAGSAAVAWLARARQAERRR